MNIFEWIEQELKPRQCNSPEFMYDDMASQSNYCLPIIYQPFDATKKSHWRDRGACFDYLFATEAEGKRLLDFGPGDGWPSLIVAPYVNEVIGVDASEQRVKVCTENAQRLGISNVHFIHVKPGERLPCQDESFDGVMAASSIEQTPDPRWTLQELYRILKPGGRLRFDYEALGMYQGGREQEVMLEKHNDTTSVFTFYDRHIIEEYAVMYKIFVSMQEDDIKSRFAKGKNGLPFDAISNEGLHDLKSRIIDVRKCKLLHPCCRTYVLWLKKIGFREIFPSYSGILFADQLYSKIEKQNHPETQEGIDNLLRPLIKITVNMAAPLHLDPMITATK